MSAPVSFIECVSKMAYTRVLSCVMLALILRIIASIQLNHAIIDIQENYKRRRLNLSRLLSTTTSTFTGVKRLKIQTWEQREKILDQTRSYKRLVEQLCRSRRWSKDCRLKSIAHARSVYDIVLCVYERFRVDGWKRYVNDDRFRVDGDKNMRLLAFAFTIVFVWTGPQATTIRSCFFQRMLED